MSKINDSQHILFNSAVDDSLLTWIEAFLNDRKAQGVANGILRFYAQKLKIFLNYCEANTVEHINKITAPFILRYFLSLEESGHSPGEGMQFFVVCVPS